MLDCRDGFGKAGKLQGLVLLQARAVGARDVVMRGNLELEPAPRGPGAPALHVMRKRLLPGVEIDGGDALAGLQQADRDMHAGRGLAGAPLLVSEHDHVRGPRVSDRRLEKHATPPARHSLFASMGRQGGARRLAWNSVSG